MSADTDTPASDQAPTTEDTAVDEVLASMRDRLVAELDAAALYSLRCQPRRG